MTTFDPALSAFMRAMGVAEQDVYATARQQGDLAERQFTRQIPTFEDETRLAVQGVDDDFEARGVYRSGARLVKGNEARIGGLRRQEEARAQMLDARSAYNLDAARKVADIRRSGAESGLEARTRMSEGAARSAYGG